MNKDNEKVTTIGEYDAELKKEAAKKETYGYNVIEIFDSIQGEGSMMGMPVTFIRFQGCNLSCPWCDTKESWVNGNPSPKADFLYIEDITEKCARDIVVLTGGEPCMQKLEPLIEALQMKGKFVCIETNGTFATPANANWIVCSPKPNVNYKIHDKCHYDELKFVVDDNFDADKHVPEHLKAHCGQVWLQPCDYGKGNEEKSTASMEKCVELAMTKNYLRVGIQLHKLISVK